MWATALPPPPPIPTTLMIAWAVDDASGSSTSILRIGLGEGIRISNALSGQSGEYAADSQAPVWARIGRPREGLRRRDGSCAGPFLITQSKNRVSVQFLQRSGGREHFLLPITVLRPRFRTPVPRSPAFSPESRPTRAARRLGRIDGTPNMLKSLEAASH
jgi:hypothetical protein